MALFGSKKENKVKAPAKSEAKPLPKTAVSKKEDRALKPGSLRIDEAKSGGEKATTVIFNPRITERASLVTEDNGYTFDVHPKATKNDVKKAIKEMYGVNPVRVNISYRRGKTVWIRGKYGNQSGGKKAIVFLPEGQKIEFV